MHKSLNTSSGSRINDERAFRHLVKFGCWLAVLSLPKPRRTWGSGRQTKLLVPSGFSCALNSFKGVFRWSEQAGVYLEVVYWVKSVISHFLLVKIGTPRPLKCTRSRSGHEENVSDGFLDRRSFPGCLVSFPLLIASIVCTRKESNWEVGNFACLLMIFHICSASIICCSKSK